MNTIDLTTLIPRCHEASKANGWWEPRPNAGQQLMLVVSELSEALEADRNGKKCTVNADVLIGFKQDAKREHNAFAANFKVIVKDTVADELADAYIRLCDFAGGFEFDIAAIRCEKAAEPLPENFGAALLEITEWVVAIGTNELAREYYLSDALARIEDLCTREGIDLATHIDLKLTYNATRGQKHGGKAY